MRVLLLILFLSVTAAAQTPTANAGPDRTALVNEPLSLSGSGTNNFDGFISNGQHSIHWDLGFDGWTFEQNFTAPVAYPAVGTYTVTLTVCSVSEACISDTAQVTVSAITEGAETIVGDSGNPTTNGVNLCNTITSLAATNNPVVTITAGVIYRMPGTPCILPARTGVGYFTLRTSAWASLSNSTTRVFPADSGNMAILEPGPNGNNPAINSAEAIFRTPVGSVAHHYRFLGIHFQKTFPTLEYLARAFIDIGRGNETSLAQLPHHFIIDRCFIDGGSTTSNTKRGIAIEGSDIAIVNSYIYRFKGVGIETQAIFVGMGERIAIINSFLQGASQHILFGGADPSIVGHVPTDIIIARNNMQKDLGWCAICGSYYGVDMSVKNSLEFKIVNRALVIANQLADHWQEDQNWSFTVTVRDQDGTAPWSNISYVDYAYNRMVRFGGGVQVLGHDSPNVSGNLNHLLIRQSIFTGCSFYNGQKNGLTITAGDGAGPISVIRSSFDCNGSGGQGRWLEFDGNTGFIGCTFNGNVAQGFINWDNAHKGESALQQACSSTSWEAKKNGFYASDGVNPTNNTTVSTQADVRFTNVAGFNLQLASGSPFLTTGLAGSASSADVAVVNQMTRGVVSGSWTSGQVCKWSTNPACN